MSMLSEEREAICAAMGDVTSVQTARLDAFLKIFDRGLRASGIEAVERKLIHELICDAGPQVAHQPA
jgi:hypothetical protein